MRVVTFHFDDTALEAQELWARQDKLMRGDFGPVDGFRPEALENPVRLIRGNKQQNPRWQYIPEWAYFKAPTTKDYKFPPHNRNWSAGVLYNQPACWVGCRQCSVQCLTRNKQM